MANIVLRVIGGLCLSGVAIAGLSWWNTETIMTPLRETVTLPSGKITSFSFTPSQETSQRNYVLRLYFENPQQLSLNCNDIRLLGIQWSISNSADLRSWNGALSSSQSRNYSCYANGSMTIAKFRTLQFRPDNKYYLHLATNSKTDKMNKVKIHVAIQHDDGLETHYLFMDKAVAELLAGGLLLISFSCFIIECFSALTNRKKPT